MRESPADNRGMAAIVAVVTLVLLGALVSGSLLVATRQARAGSGGLQAVAAFYAAEAGLTESLLGWDWDLADSLALGVPVLAASGELATGDSYQVFVTRLGSSHAETGAYYLITSTGLARGPRGGRRRVAMLVREPVEARWCCGAAVTVAAEIQVEGGGAIRGGTEEPPAWSDVPDLCADSSGARPAILTGSGPVQAFGDALIEGSPPVQELDVGLENALREIESAFNDLAARSDIVLGSGAHLEDIGPVVNAGGECDPSQPTNWGEPLVPGHPCFGHLPVVHARGDLAIETLGRGQGILLVEGDLSLGGGFEFYGLVVVLGDLDVKDGRIFGAVLAPGHSSTVRVGSGSQIGFSECGARRALRAAKLVLPHPLAQFSWLEILE